MDEYINNLNEEQQQAVMATEGMVGVVAGAGSGKTRALSSRFAFLVNEIGILPGNILCVTFTNKAANEMRQRIHQLTGDNDTGYINTFHGFCVSVLQEDSHVVQYPKSFLVLDNSDIDTMLQTVYEERGLTLRDMTFSHARDMIEMIKLKERPRYYLDMIGMRFLQGNFGMLVLDEVIGAVNAGLVDEQELAGGGAEEAERGAADVPVGEEEADDERRQGVDAPVERDGGREIGEGVVDFPRAPDKGR